MSHLLRLFCPTTPPERAPTLIANVRLCQYTILQMMTKTMRQCCRNLPPIVIDEKRGGKSLTETQERGDQNIWALLKECEARMRSFFTSGQARMP